MVVRHRLVLGQQLLDAARPCRTSRRRRSAAAACGAASPRGRRAPADGPVARSSASIERLRLRSLPSTETYTIACSKSREQSTLVTVTKPSPGSVISPSASPRIWRINSLTRRTRSLMSRSSGVTTRRVNGPTSAPDAYARRSQRSRRSSRPPASRSTSVTVRRARCQTSWWSTSATEAPARCCRWLLSVSRCLRLPFRECSPGKRSSNERMPTYPDATALMSLRPRLRAPRARARARRTARPPPSARPRVPRSTMWPRSITTISSARRTVARRWAITIEVRPCSRRSSAFSISTSVGRSMFDVASSRIRMRGSASSARPIEMSCRSPAERPEPPSRTACSRPSREARRDAVEPDRPRRLGSTCSSLAPGAAKRRLSAMLPANRNGSCRTTPSWRR